MPIDIEKKSIWNKLEDRCIAMAGEYGEIPAKCWFTLHQEKIIEIKMELPNGIIIKIR